MQPIWLSCHMSVELFVLRFILVFRHRLPFDANGCALRDTLILTLVVLV